MSSEFEGANLLLSNAEKHFSEVSLKERVFSEGKPYTTIVDKETDPENDIYKIVLASEFPPSIKTTVADSINNIRNSLDHAVVASAKLLGMQNVGNLHFPFANSLSELDNTIKGRCKGIRPEIVTLMRSFQPYKGGNDLLWAINKLANVGKHQMLIGVNAKGNLSEWGLIANRPPEPCAPFWDSRKNELIFAIMSKGGQLHGHVNLSLHIAFGDIEVVGFQPVVSTLNHMIGIAKSIVLAIEAETFRLARP